VLYPKWHSLRVTWADILALSQEVLLQGTLNASHAWSHFSGWKLEQGIILELFIQEKF